MSLTLLVPDAPTELFGAVFTQNAFPGAPIIVGRGRLAEPSLGAIVINNKISNVCAAGDGVADSERLCGAVAAALGLPGATAVLPSSTGVIGWRLPVDQMLEAVPSAVATLQAESALPAATGIMTTDLYPKVWSAELHGGGRVVGIAKGAGMIEPNMATMLAYIITDVAVPRELLREVQPVQSAHPARQPGSQPGLLTTTPTTTGACGGGRTELQLHLGRLGPEYLGHRCNSFVWCRPLRWDTRSGDRVPGGGGRGRAQHIDASHSGVLLIASRRSAGSWRSGLSGTARGVTI